MKAKVFPILIAAMFAVSGMGALAQDHFKLFGSIGGGGIGSSENARDAAKLEEYRGLSDGAFGVFDLRGRSKRFYLDWYGENLGRTDTYFNLKGGMYGQLKYSVHGDWLTHNFGFGPNGARTPFVSPGSTNLALFSNIPAILSNSAVPPWTSFKFSTDRRDIGGTFEFSGGSPWYVLIDANQIMQEGTDKVDAAALGTSPGNGFVDLPYPIGYSTRSISAEAGYQKPKGHFSVNWLQSNFGNDNVRLNFQNPFFGFGTDTSVFAPGSHYIRISANGMRRQLSLDSTLSARVTYDKVIDKQDMINAVLNTSGSAVLTPTSPSSQTFDGQVENTTAHISLASVPIRRLDTRIYYNFYKRTNSSTNIAFEVPLTTAGLVCITESATSAVNVNVFCEGERYGYAKNNPGLEAGYRITTGNRLSAGFDYLRTRRNRFDSNETREKKSFVQWSNTSLDTLTVRLKYQYLQRRSDFLTGHAGFNANDQFFLERFNRSFDVSNLNQHLVKAYFDWSPLQFLDFGFEAYYKRNNYMNLTLGRLNDRRKEFYGSVSYGDPTKFRVSLFGDVELINYDSFHRTINSGSPCPATAPNCFDPLTPPTATAFNWAAQLRDKNWTVELGADWPVRENLTLKGSAIIQETRGSVDFQSQILASGAPATLLFPITAYDNTRRRSINPHAVYLLIKHVELTLGYSYERYDYSDDQFTGYQYTVGSGTTASYLSGIYAFPDYHAHIAYGTLRYLF